ncbi:MAG: nucleotidyltransferase [Deltaproteobacteria bacterium RIFCSPLOWO2_02_44_9]|nr:MAG: nucleotidyltransferase [Deltaproteobacteria bacterium RIFCSPLOWO2_02_44_9]
MENLTKKEKKILTELKDNLRKTLAGKLVAFKLYGSKARGDYDYKSDIDVAIIVNGLTREIKNHTLDIVADIELKYLTPISTLVISKENFELLKKRERRIALDIEREGISL